MDLNEIPKKRVVLAKDLQEVLVDALKVYNFEGWVTMPQKEFEAFQYMVEQSDLIILDFLASGGCN